MAIDDPLARRLVAAGVDPDRVTDAAAAWRALHDSEGRRATLLDRYALEEHIGGPLEPSNRAALGAEVLAAQYPGIELFGVAGGDPVAVVPYDDGWADRFAEWRDRLAGVLQRSAVRIEHVGSTGVPGLPAKPVIDIQVSVATTEDEASYRPAIESLGLPLRAREPGHRYFRPPAGSPRVVQVHVCDRGGSWERDHLLFRDFLRAHADVRGRYAALKRTLAERHRSDRIAYTEGKTGFILDALARAKVWADEVGWAP